MRCSRTSPGARSSSSTWSLVAVALVAGSLAGPGVEGAAGPRALDLLGAALSVAALTAVTYTLIQAPAGRLAVGRHR